MSKQFTRVEIVFYPEHVNHWLRFGVPDEEHELDRRRAIALFQPGRVFGYVRWCANEYGTREWRFFVIKSTEPSRFLSRVEGVYPGGEILLLAVGNTKVRCALSAVDVLEEAGFEPADVSPDYYRHVHNRITAGQLIRPYTDQQHTAHLAAQWVTS